MAGDQARARWRIARVVLLLIAGVRPASAQELSNWFVRSGISSAHVLPVSPFDSTPASQDHPIDWVPDLTFEIGRQTDGGQEWHHLYGMPAYGVGVSIASFRNGVEHGRPIEAYTFFSWPFITLNDRVAVTTDIGMGFSWNWQQVDDRTLDSTPVLGSNVNALIDWGFYLRYRSTSRLTVFTGIDFTHRSNGGVAQTNKGINVLGPKVSVQYGLGPLHPKPPAIDPPAFKPTWQFAIGTAGGVKQVVDGSGHRRDVGVSDTSLSIERYFYRYGKAVGGSDLTYTEPWAVGVYGGYEHVIARFSVFAHLGYNVARGFEPDTRFPRLYQRYGWRFHFTDRGWASIAVRAIEGNRAEFLEVGAGYRVIFGR